MFSFKPRLLLNDVEINRIFIKRAWELPYLKTTQCINENTFQTTQKPFPRRQSDHNSENIEEVSATEK